MPKSILYRGAVWGSLRCTDVRYERRPLDDNNSYDGGGRQAVKYTLQCNCGKVFDVWGVEFKGKRITRDCGCGYATDILAYIDAKFRIPLDTMKLIREFIGEDGMSLSHAANELLLMGWQKYLETGEKSAGVKKEVEQNEEDRHGLFG